MEQQNNTIEMLISLDSTIQTVETNANSLDVNNSDIISSVDDIIINTGSTESFSILSSLENIENATFNNDNTLTSFIKTSKNLNNVKLDSDGKLVINFIDSISKLE